MAGRTGRSHGRAVDQNKSWDRAKPEAELDRVRNSYRIIKTNLLEVSIQITE